MTSICKICKVDNDKIGDHDLLERLGELMHGKKYTVHYFCMVNLFIYLLKLLQKLFFNFQ